MEERMAAQAETPMPQESAAHAQEESLARREAEIARRELRAQALMTLADRQMPSELAELLNYEDAERCTASLASVQKIWQQAVQRGVESRVAGITPRTGAGKGGARSTMREAISAYYSK